MAVIDSAYQYYLSTYAGSGMSRYDTHKKSQLRASLIEMLHIQLTDNQKACWVDDKLQNVFKKRASGTPAVRAQYDFYEWLSKKAQEAQHS